MNFTNIISSTGNSISSQTIQLAAIQNAAKCISRKRYLSSLTRPQVQKKFDKIIKNSPLNSHLKQYSTAIQQQQQQSQIPKESNDIEFYKELSGKSGGQIVIEMLKRLNVDTVFGYPGGTALPIIDNLYFYKNDINFVVPRHEQGAGHMAEGYARSTGKVGVVIVTSGPGATNIITPLADALNDGTPMIAISAQVPTFAIGTDFFQEADMVGISRSCTKWNVMVKDVRELPRRIEEAFHIATSGRPGPVLIDIPKDVLVSVLRQEIKKSYGLNFPFSRPFVYNVDPKVALKKSIEHAACMINNAERPVIIAGAGIMNHPEGPAILAKLSKRGNIPVATSFQGLGCFDETNPLSLHMIGMHGSAYGNLAVQAADVLIVLGSRMDERATGFNKKFALGAKKAERKGYGGIIHFEIQPKNINKIINVTEAVEGDVTENVKSMLPLIQRHFHSQWNEQIQEWKKKYPFTYIPSKPGNPIKPQAVIQELNRLTERNKENIIISTGVGQHQMWVAQYYRWKYPKSLISSGALGTMGFGIPAALGAKIANPDKCVIDIDGDASFSMTGQELATCNQFGIPIKVLILNNSCQGMVKQMQDLFYDNRLSQTIMGNPDFVELCKAMGSETIHTKDPTTLTRDLNKFLNFKHPTKSIVLVVDIDQNEHVYPMVAGTNGLHEMECGNTLKINEPNFAEKYF